MAYGHYGIAGLVRKRGFHDISMNADNGRRDEREPAMTGMRRSCDGRARAAPLAAWEAR